MMTSTSSAVDRGHGADFGLLRFERYALLCLTVCGHPNVADRLHAVQHGSSAPASSSPKCPDLPKNGAKTIEKPLKNDRATASGCCKLHIFGSLRNTPKSRFSRVAPQNQPNRRPSSHPAKLAMDNRPRARAANFRRWSGARKRQRQRVGIVRTRLPTLYHVGLRFNHEFASWVDVVAGCLRRAVT